MKIIIDAFGGDYAPLEPLKGAADAVKELGVEVLAGGDSAKMEACCKENHKLNQDEHNAFFFSSLFLGIHFNILACAHWPAHENFKPGNRT